MSKRYKERPSKIIGIECEYTAYCFDEAVDYIIVQLEQDKKPMFNKFKEHYKSFSDLYKDAKKNNE